MECVISLFPPHIGGNIPILLVIRLVPGVKNKFKTIGVSQVV